MSLLWWLGAAVIIVPVAGSLAFVHLVWWWDDRQAKRQRVPEPADLPGLTDQDRAWVRHHQQLAGTVDRHAEFDAFGAALDKLAEQHIRHQELR